MNAPTDTCMPCGLSWMTVRLDYLKFAMPLSQIERRSMLKRPGRCAANPFLQRNPEKRTLAWPISGAQLGRHLSPPGQADTRADGN